MKIHAFLLCWNEIDIMPLIIRHYQKFCDKVTIYDNYSTDGGPQLAREMGCDVVQFGDNIPNGFNDRHNRDVKNSCWKNSDADWVIVADFDEVLMAGFSPNLHSSVAENIFHAISQRTENCTIFRTYGWQVMSDDWPAHDLLEITNGYHFSNYSKSIIFNPKEIKEINYDFGAHLCNPKGNVVWSNSPLYVLHYKHIGGVHRTIDRYRILQQRLSKENRKQAWGIHYNRSPASIRQEWNERMAKSKPLI